MNPNKLSIVTSLIDDHDEKPVERATRNVNRQAETYHLDVATVESFFERVNAEVAQSNRRIALVTNDDELLDGRLIERLERIGELYAPEVLRPISMQLVRREELEGLRGQYEEVRKGGLLVQRVPVVYRDSEIIRTQIGHALNRLWQAGKSSVS